MGASFGGSASDDVVSEINVTPLVDVVLVLLVIFLITAPALYQSTIQVQLPQSKTSEQASPAPITLSLTESGEVYWNKESLTWPAFQAKVKDSAATLKALPQQGLVISADSKTDHGKVIQVMDEFRQAGLTKFAIQVSEK